MGPMGPNLKPHYVGSSVDFRGFRWSAQETSIEQQAYMAYKSRLNIWAEVYWLKIKTLLFFPQSIL